MTFLAIASLLLNLLLIARLARARRAAPSVNAAVDDAGAAGPHIQVRVLNPLALAANRSWLGRAIGGLAPNAVRRLVYREVMRRLASELRDQGVEADIRLVDPGRVSGTVRG